MNAAQLLSHLVARGTARRGPARPGIAGVVIVSGFEVAIALDPSERSMRARLRERVGNRPVSYLLVADDPERPGWLRVLGPASADAPIRAVEAAALARAIGEAAEMGTLDSVRHLAEEIARLGGQGIHMEGLLSRHTVEVRFRENVALWANATAATSALRPSDGWRAILTKLGYGLEQLPTRGYLARYKGRPVAVVHPKNSARAFTRLDEQGRPPEGLLARDCHAAGVSYGLLAHEGRFRLFDTASTQEWLDLDYRLLRADRKPFLALLSPSSLCGDGFAELQAEARHFGTELRERLDRTIRFEAFPALAAGLDQWILHNDESIKDDAQREELERAALTLMFRLLFTLYAEGSDFLPMDNATYRRKSLTGLVAEAADTRDKWSEESTALWSQFEVLVRAMRHGNRAWDVPAYNGSLFDPTDFEGAELLERMELTDPHFAQLLLAVGWDSSGNRGIDYSSLEIGHLGHIYEALLSLRLSVTDRPLRYDRKEDRYVPDDSSPEIGAGKLLWQTHEGGRKAGGVYYTPAELVEHLVRGAVVPAFDRHLEKVRAAAATDPDAAVHELFSFSVLDPACGSAHFLVHVVETLADMTVRFLAETPIPGISTDLDRLRAGTSAGAGVDDTALLRRLILKHCVFGVDVSPMGAEIALMSLWLASFVPGLSLSYLDRNVIVGDSLLGVASPETVGKAGTIWYEHLLDALGDAIAAVVRLAEIDDRTPEEVEASKVADAEAWAATEGAHNLFDLWAAKGFDLDTKTYVETHALDVILRDIDTHGQQLIRTASSLGQEHRFLHWPLAFPRVFDPSRKRPGFNVVVGNPPWKEITAERLAFYTLHKPGIGGLSAPRRSRAIRDLDRQRPELRLTFDQEKKRMALQRKALKHGEYDSMGSGDPDLYRYFCYRYMSLIRKGGSLGVVLPRSVCINDGSTRFRQWLFEESTTHRIDYLKNKKNWAFADVVDQQTVALILTENCSPDSGHRVEIAAMAESKKEWAIQSKREGVYLSLPGFGPSWMTPLISSQAEAELLVKVRGNGSPFPYGQGGKPAIFAVSELHETNHKHLWTTTEFASNSSQASPLWQGKSFTKYDPHGYNTRWCPDPEAVLDKLRRKRPGAFQRLASEAYTLHERRQAMFTELGRARVAYRAINRSTDPRTIVACLVPPHLFLVNSAPYLVFVGGSEKEQAVCLGIMNSIVFDWQARRYIERNVSIFIISSQTVPRLSDDDFETVSRHAARLSAVDDRFAEFARATGVEIGPLDAIERQRLLVDIDARVARAWKLTPDDLVVMLEDFTTDAVPPAYRTALLSRLIELT